MARILIAGDTHGLLDQLYNEAKEYQPDVMIQLGDTGMFPHPERADHASKKHGVPLDFLSYFHGSKLIPIPTKVIQGNHEDFDYLCHPVPTQLLSNLTFFPNGFVFTQDGIRFGVLGGNYSPKYFDSSRLVGPRRRHFTRAQTDQLEVQGCDVLLSHDGPLSDALPHGCQELTALIERMQPEVVYHGHHHHAYTTSLGKSKVVGLAKIGGMGRSLILHEF